MKNYPVEKRLLLKTLQTILLVCFSFLQLKSQVNCVLACNSEVQFILEPGETLEAKPFDFLEAINGCDNPQFSFTDLLKDSTLLLSGDAPGFETYQITELQSQNSCWGNYTVVSAACADDTEPPTFDSQPQNIVINCDEPIPNAPTITASDNCDASVTVTMTEESLDQGCPGKIAMIRTYRATDGNFNSIEASQIIRIAGGQFSVKVPADYQGSCDQDFNVDKMELTGFSGCDIFATTYEDIVLTGQPCIKILRRHTAINWCYADLGTTGSLPNYDADSDGLNDEYTVDIDMVSGQMTYPPGIQPPSTIAPAVFEYTQIIEYPQCNAPIAVCQNISTTVLAGQDVEIWGEDLNDRSFDDCSFDDLELRIIWADSSDQTTVPTTNFLSIDPTFSGKHQTELWVGDDEGNWSYCTAEVEIITGLQTGNIFSGNVFSDKNGDCIWDRDNEDGLEDWLVKIIGFPSGMANAASVSTSNRGAFSISLPDMEDTLYQVSLISNINYGQQCPTVYDFKGELGNQVFELEIPVVLENDCPLLAVDLNAIRLRRCFPSNYEVNYCNYGGATAVNSFVEVELDPFLIYLNSGITPSSVQGNTYTFPIGDIASGECGKFRINTEVSCDAILGQTHCSSASIFPDTLCNSQISPDWSGATIVADAECVGDSVQLTLKNIGKGDMDQSLNFIIIEDVLMYRQGNFDLEAGEEVKFPMVASGATWSILAEQAPMHPNADAPSLSIEGCVKVPGSNFSTGFVSNYAQNRGDGFTDIDCQENIGSYDPNDKQATPRGYGDRFQIDQNVDLEYKIRFQNTGTDTAFTVRIEDKLSEHLDASTILPGASSHDYDFCVHDDGTIEFLFENIMLPDSFVNEPASNGFVNFKVAQQPNVTIETIIPNTANIYFDFNDPVITNEVNHTIGLDFITVSVDEMPKSLGFEVFPNPFKERATLYLNESNSGDWQLEIYNLAGKQIRVQKAKTNQLSIDRKNMTEGVYFFKIKTTYGREGTGKFILSQ